MPCSLARKNRKLKNKNVYVIPGVQLSTENAQTDRNVVSADRSAQVAGSDIVNKQAKDRLKQTCQGK